jgi:hypothetical protein
MYAMMRGLDSIDHKIDELVQHKKQFVFGGDMVILNSTFKELGVDVSKCVERSVRRKNKHLHPSDDPNSELG